MTWVGSFKSLQSVLRRPRFTGAPLEVRTWVRSEIALISPLVDWLMSLIAASRCVCGEEDLVELALREALSNAMIHGNRLDTRKLVHVRCWCGIGKGVFIVVRDQGHGFDPNKVPDPLAFENLRAEHGRGIHLMKLAMDEVSFERGGKEVHMRKVSGREKRHPPAALELHEGSLADPRPGFALSNCVGAHRMRRVKHVESMGIYTKAPVIQRDGLLAADRTPGALH
jgi:anti-sigma regulatory factor (Ser/Thr protein kinase)